MRKSGEQRTKLKRDRADGTAEDEAKAEPVEEYARRNNEFLKSDQQRKRSKGTVDEDEA